MSLIVETGEGLPNAESYVAVSDADAYHVKFGNAAWAALSEDAKEIALRAATRYIDARYNFRGEMKSYQQALAWPRVGYEHGDIYEGWPVVRLNRATMELALTSTTTPLYSNQLDRVVIEQTVGPITQKFSAGKQGGQIRFALVDDLMGPLIAGGGGTSLSMRVSRA